MKRALRSVAPLAARAVAYGLLIPLLWLVEPFWRIRLTHMWSARFGPLCFTLHTWAVRRHLEGPERRTWRLMFGAKPANRQLWEMWRRIFPIRESRWFSAFYHYAGPGLARTRFFRPLPEEFADHALVNHPSGMRFVPEEERRGRALLETMGIGEGDWYVTFQARDPAYHAQRGAFGDSGAHHNCAVETYLAAAAHVIRLGGFAVRMGASAERPLPDGTDPRIIDYSTRFRSDFGDVWLFGNCRFHLGCSTGSNFGAILFNRPVAQANMMPLRPVPSGRSSLYWPVLIRERSSGRLMTFKELEALGAYEYEEPAMCARWQYPGGMEAIGLEIVNNDEDEILSLCKDMFDRLEGRAPDAAITERQAWYKRRFFAHVPTIGEGPDIAPGFIAKYPFLFED